MTHKINIAFFLILALTILLVGSLSVSMAQEVKLQYIEDDIEDLKDRLKKIEDRLKNLENKIDDNSATQLEIKYIKQRLETLDNKLRELNWDKLVNQKQRNPYPTSHTPAGEGPFGDWYEAKYCPVNQYVCGIAQKVESHKRDIDDTTMNALRFYCCPL